ncbi:MULTISPECIES: nitroreductase family protein [unclassified Neisseria]|uniref:nitroreductase family protein n=1 Tax=unclassified Neisseria TaxID=2623750 RepID=UPI0010726C7F|nr:MULTISPECIES: nitroreductase family protein [unclassified Neisseria]MBF0802964.1 nitroreductase family protein [Neisseria sp. 19428wB4_WF04]TFU44491.1 nitroreductase family protein [Neisseria sp. WF04]
MAYQNIQQTAEARRSVYALNQTLPLPAAEVAGIVEHAVLHTPSSFNSQSTRVVVLLGAEHEKLWQFAEDALRAIVPADKFAPTRQKLDMFKAAAGSVLFFEDQEVVKGLQAQFPAYADNFPVWAEHANAMHQYAVWTTLAAAGIGANLQHYNPLIDAAVAKEWALPASWTLRAQMVFGGIAAPAGEKTFAPLEGRFKVFGA